MIDRQFMKPRAYKTQIVMPIVPVTRDKTSNVMAFLRPRPSISANLLSV